MTTREGYRCFNSSTRATILGEVKISVEFEIARPRQQDEPPDSGMEKQILDRLIVQQIIDETKTVFQAEYLMHRGVLQIRVDEKHRLGCFHGKTHGQIDGSQCLTLTVTWACHPHHIPPVFRSRCVTCVRRILYASTNGPLL